MFYDTCGALWICEAICRNMLVKSYEISLRLYTLTVILSVVCLQKEAMETDEGEKKTEEQREETADKSAEKSTDEVKEEVTYLKPVHSKHFANTSSF